MVFLLSLSDSKSPQVSGTLLSILAGLYNVVVWTVSTRPLISKYFSPFNNSLVTVPKAPITISIIVPFVFHSFFIYPSFHILSVLFCGLPEQQSPQFCNFIFFSLLIIIRFGLLAEIRWSVCTSKSHRNLWGSFCRIDAGLCIYNLFVWSNLDFLHISQWITFPTQSYYYYYY